MKTIVRNSVFETNSSSTHSLTMCLEELWIPFRNGETYLKGEGSRARFLTPEEVMKEIAEREKVSVEEIKTMVETDQEQYDDLLIEHDYTKWDNLGYNEYETFVDSFTTPNGEKIIAFGYFGNNY